MPKKASESLSRRERQVMDEIYRLREAPVTAIMDAIENPPSYSSVRATMNILVQKGLLTTRRDGKRLVYRAVRPRRGAAREAIHRLVNTFFDGSVQQAVEGMISSSDRKLTDQQLDELQQFIDKARKEGR